MLEPLIAIGVVFYFFTRSFLVKPPEKTKSEEENLGEALVKYLEKGIKVRTQ